jgi:hypothetical protein
MNGRATVARLESRAQEEGELFFNLVAEESTISAKELDFAFYLGWEIPQVEHGNRPGVQIVEPSPTPVPTEASHSDPEGDVYNCDSGADVEDHPELDLVDWSYDFDDESEGIVVQFSFAQEPKPNQFVSGYLSYKLEDEFPAERPTGDPFASLSRYLYFWRMGADSFAGVIEQVDGEFEVVDDQVQLTIGDATMTATFWDPLLMELVQQPGSWPFAGTTDSLGSCDYAPPE